MASAAMAPPPPSPTAEDVWRSRRQRTVRVTLDPAGRPYGRADFIRQVNDTVGLPSLEAVGPTQESNVWELTFSSQITSTQFVAGGDFNVRGFKAAVQAADNQCYRVRLHWVPYYVPHEVFVEAFQAAGAKVVAAEFDKSAVKGMEHVCSGLRTYTIRTSHPADIPHLIPFSSGHEQREALVTMTGRLPLCLRCRTSGHVRQQCKMPFCWRCKSYGHTKKDCPGRTYASAADPKRGPDPSNQPDDEEEEEDPVNDGSESRPTEDTPDRQSDTNTARRDVEKTDDSEQPPPDDVQARPDDNSTVTQAAKEPEEDVLGPISDDDMENEIPPTPNNWEEIVSLHEKNGKTKAAALVADCPADNSTAATLADGDIADMELEALGLQSSIARRKRSGASLSESDTRMSSSAISATESIPADASWSMVRDNKRVRTPGSSDAAVKHINLPAPVPARSKVAELTPAAFRKNATAAKPRKEKDGNNTRMKEQKTPNK